MSRIGVLEYLARAAAIAAFGMLLLSVPIARAQQGPRFQKEFSADLISNAAGHETTSRFYASKNRTRSEIIRNGVVIGIMIMDFQNNTGWELLPRQKMAIDMSAAMKAGQEIAKKDILTGAPPDPNDPCAALRGATCRKLGSETVNGRQTQKWEMKDKEGKVMTLWIDPSLPLAVRTQWANGSGEYRNIREGPQPVSLFEVPPDYRKTAGPMAPPTAAPGKQQR